MQVTGNNNSKKSKILSIRLSPSGLYFDVNGTKVRWISANGILKHPGEFEKLVAKKKLASPQYTQVNLSFCSEANSLIPLEFAPLTEGEIILSEECDQVVEQFCPPSPILKSASKLFGQRLKLVSGMKAIQSQGSSRRINLALYHDLCCVVISDEQTIEFARYLPYSSYNDLIFYLTELQCDANSKIIISFDSSNKLAKKIRPYFKNTTYAHR